MIQFVLRKGPLDLWTCVYFTAECVASSADGQGIHGWAYWSAFHVVIVYWLKTWYQTCAVIYSPYIWLQKENVLWCKYLSIVKLAEQMSLTWTFLPAFHKKKKERNKKVSSSVTVLASNMIPNLCWHTIPTHGSKRNM